MGKRKAKSKEYFTKETEQAIVKYNKSTDPFDRDQIYREHIEYPFNKLAENVINRFKFPYMNLSFEDTKRQVVSFLCTQIEKYAENKGKAFSYFSVIAKNYLILHNNIGHKNEKRLISLSESTSESDIPLENLLLIDNSHIERAEDTKEFVKLLIIYWDNNVHRIFKKKRDIEIANAVIELFRRSENIENFNKKAIYLMIREMTNCKTGYITKVLNKMKVHIEKQLSNYREYGLIDPNRSKFFIDQ